MSAIALGFLTVTWIFGCQDPGTRPPEFDAARKKAVEALANDWFKARPATRFDDWDDKTHAALLARAKALDPLPDTAIKEVRALLWKAARGHGPKLDPSKPIDTHWGKAGYALDNAPRGAAGAGLGLLVGLHGGGEGAGDKSEAAAAWNAALAKNKLIGIYPQAIQLVHDAWCTPEGERFVLTLIEMAKRTYDLDPARVYSAGFSMGGTGTWWLCGRYPQLFAGGMPFHGVLFNDGQQTDHESQITSVQHGLIPNVRHVPLYYTTGSVDHNCLPYSYEYAARLLDELRKTHPGDYEINYRCVPGLAHAFAPGEPAAACKWLLGRKRLTFPKTVTWEALVNPTFPPGDGRARVHGSYWLRCDAPVEKMLVEAEIQGQTVALKVERHEPKGFTVYLCADLIDVTKEVTITCNGEQKYRGTPAASLVAMIETMSEFFDRELVFDRRVDF
ncbi:MAG TPA: PHB depolymerase family esterase [Planctomycetota bacterium]|nr:PHB depolymerase family esterase [Planctomycetota bacterium]